MLTLGLTGVVLCCGRAERAPRDVREPEVRFLKSAIIDPSNWPDFGLENLRNQQNCFHRRTATTTKIMFFRSSSLQLIFGGSARSSIGPPVVSIPLPASARDGTDFPASATSTRNRHGQ